MEDKKDLNIYFFEAELSSQTIIKQKIEVPYPAMTWDDILGNLKTLDQWRLAVGTSLDKDEKCIMTK